MISKTNTQMSTCMYRNHQKHIQKFKQNTLFLSFSWFFRLLIFVFHYVSSWKPCGPWCHLFPRLIPLSLLVNCSETLSSAILMDSKMIFLLFYLLEIKCSKFFPRTFNPWTQSFQYGDCQINSRNNLRNTESCWWDLYFCNINIPVGPLESYLFNLSQTTEPSHLS